MILEQGGYHMLPQGLGIQMVGDREIMAFSIAMEWI